MEKNEENSIVVKESDLIRPDYNWTYPIYHRGLYLEQYFYQYFLEHKDVFGKLNREYLPIFFTNIYHLHNFNGIDICVNYLSHYFKSLDKNKKYFAVTQHDDAIYQKHDLDILQFSAGGNYGDIPIPLVASKIPDVKENKKDIFCSFIGSQTHSIRLKMIEVLKNNKKYCLEVNKWVPVISQSNYEKFIDITSRSIFCLCPRGYGPSSFRLYEAMQLGSIPVYIYDKRWLPWEDKINWNDICILIPEEKIKDIDSILSGIDQKRIEFMMGKIKEYYNDYFTIESTAKNILDFLKNDV